MQVILVFLQTSVRHFPVAELALYNPEYMFHFAADGGFAVFHVPFPVDCVVMHLGQKARNDSLVVLRMFDWENSDKAVQAFLACFRA